MGTRTNHVPEARTACIFISLDRSFLEAHFSLQGDKHYTAALCMLRVPVQAILSRLSAFSQDGAHSLGSMGSVASVVLSLAIHAGCNCCKTS